MTPYEIAAFISISILFGFGLWQLNQQNKRRWSEFLEAQKSDQSIALLGQWLQEMRGSLDRQTDSLNLQMQSSNKVIGERLDNAARVIRIISKELGQVQEIARQMRDFHDFLRSPKMRGNIGEVVLRELLVQVLPHNSFTLQHRFLDGQVVDATITTEKGIIPIDAKFPLDNFQKAHKAEKEEDQKRYARQFQRDVQHHIDVISKKYIQPQEGTLDFAVMYIPSEAIYYEILTKNETVINFAQQKRILLVSPNNFFYFLRVILTGLEGRRIEEASRRILLALNAMRQDSQKVAEQLRIVSTHVTNAKGAVDQLNNDFMRLSNRIEGIKYLDSNVNIQEISKD